MRKGVGKKSKEFSFGHGSVWRCWKCSWVKNLEIPQETDVIPPENSEFHLPGADDPSIREEVTVSIKLNNL